MAEKILSVRIALTGIPDSQGVRIKTLDPKGFYLSSSNPEIVRAELGGMLLHFLLEKGCLSAYAGRAAGMKNNGLDWPKFMFEGEAEFYVNILSPEEVAAGKKNEEVHISKLSHTTVHLNSGQLLWFVNDGPGKYSPWQREQMLLDFPDAKEK